MDDDLPRCAEDNAVPTQIDTTDLVRDVDPGLARGGDGEHGLGAEQGAAQGDHNGLTGNLGDEVAAGRSGVFAQAQIGQGGRWRGHLQGIGLRGHRGVARCIGLGGGDGVACVWRDGKADFLAAPGGCPLPGVAGLGAEQPLPVNINVDQGQRFGAVALQLQIGGVVGGRVQHIDTGADLRRVQTHGLRQLLRVQRQHVGAIKRIAQDEVGQTVAIDIGHSDHGHTEWRAHRK